MLPHSRTSRRAFSLLELIVVVVILGVLSAMALPSFLSAVNRAKDSSTETTLAALGRESQALAAFHASPVTFVDVSDAAGDFPGPLGLEAAQGVTWEATTLPSTRYGQVSVTETAVGVDLAVRSRSGSCTMLSVGASEVSRVRTIRTESCTAA